MAEHEGDPIAFLREQRELNVGHIVEPLELAESEMVKKCIGSYADLPIIDLFPTDLECIFQLEKLNEQTLRKFHGRKLWDLLVQPPSTTAQLIRREEALLALNWKREYLEDRQPLFASATCPQEGKSKYKRGQCVVVFTLFCSQVTEAARQNAQKFLRKGTAVRLTRAGDIHSYSDMPSARVVKWTKQCVTLKMHLPNQGCCQSARNLFRRFEVMGKIDVYEDKFDLALRLTMEVIDRLKDGDCDHILEPAPDFERSNRHFEKALATIQPALSAYTGLNEQQTRALYAICTSAHADAPFVLHGPPGTGKTRVIAATVRCLLEMNPDARILLIAPSNMAADGIALKLIDHFAASRMTISDVLRLRSALNDCSSRDRRLDSISYMDNAKKRFVVPRTATLCEQRVIVCTIACSAHLAKFFGVGHFRRVLCQLNVSYRCHPSILSIVSEMFYSGQLLSGVENRWEPFVEWEGLPKKKFPLMVVSVEGREVFKDNSYGNEEEVRVVLEYIHRLFKDFNHLQPEDIGVISPYRYQTKLLVDALMDTEIPGRKQITVDSVERFQGSERKVIILTTTRTGGLGFLACNKRLNTSITRAMHLLLVVGDEAALSKHSSWKRYVEYAAKNMAFIRWDPEKKTDSNLLPAAQPDYRGVRKKKPVVDQRMASGKRAESTSDSAAKTIAKISGDGPYIRPSSSSSRSSGIPTAPPFGHPRNSRRSRPGDDFSPCPVLHPRPFGN